MKTAALSLALIVACCAAPVRLTVIDRASGEMGVAVIDGTKNSGPISVTLRGEFYEGIWTAVRDTGYTAASYSSIPEAGLSAFGTAAVNANTGLAVANLRSVSGRSLRCQIRYSLRGLAGVTGAGECQDEAGRGYDVHAASGSP